MSIPIQNEVAALPTAFAVALGLAPLTRYAGSSLGLTAASATVERSGRVPLLGGVAIVGGYLFSLVLWTAPPAWLLVATAGMLAVGLIDDFFKLKPGAKLLLQSLVLFAFIRECPWINLFPLPVLNGALSAVWILTVVNAYNFIDGLDGLAAGVGAISGLTIAGIGLFHGPSTLVGQGLAIAGALGAFLLFNFAPASIFMGDAGSMAVGVNLALFSIEASAVTSGAQATRATILPAVVAVPVLNLVVVILTRVAKGIPVYAHGLDHSHHGLVVRGLRVKAVLFVMYGLALVGGLSALMLDALPGSLAAIASCFVLVLFGPICFFLMDLSLRAIPEDLKPHADSRFVQGFGYKRRVGEAILDFAVIVAAYYGGALLRFDFKLSPEQIHGLTLRLPLILLLSYSALFVTGVYRGLWRYFTSRDLGRFVCASTVAALLILAVHLVDRFAPPYDIACIVIFALLLLDLLTATRASFLLIASLLNGMDLTHRRLVIVGTGDLAEAAARYLLALHGGQIKIVGFLDDDDRARGNLLFGHPVLGAVSLLEKIHGEHPFNEIVIAKEQVASREIEMLTDFARERHLVLQKFSIQLALPDTPDKESQAAVRS